MKYEVKITNQIKKDLKLAKSTSVNVFYVTLGVRFNVIQNLVFQRFTPKLI